MQEALLVLTAFVLMEFIAALAHRVIFHGFGYGIHKSHHMPRTGVFELNDFYPLISAGITMTIIALGIWVPELKFLIPVGFGMTAYGVAYFFIHDLMVHQRARWLKINPSLFKWQYEAHQLHHRFSGAPYGFVFPVVPKRLRKYLSGGSECSSQHE